MDAHALRILVAVADNAGTTGLMHDPSQDLHASLWLAVLSFNCCSVYDCLGPMQWAAHETSMQLEADAIYLYRSIKVKSMSLASLRRDPWSTTTTAVCSGATAPSEVSAVGILLTAACGTLRLRLCQQLGAWLWLDLFPLAKLFGVFTQAAAETLSG